MDAELYQEQILDRYHHPRHDGVIENATHKLEGANRSCGDELTIYLKTSGDQISEAKFSSRACAICTASADLLLDRVIGHSFDDVDQINATDIQAAVGIPLSPIRLKCALLPLETLRSYKPSDKT